MIDIRLCIMTRFHFVCFECVILVNIYLKEFLNAIRERDFLLKRASLTQNPDDWKAFKDKRNSTNKLKNTLKQTFYHDSFQDSKDNPKELWKKVKQL